ncbi:MAG TPA: hypothetical protein DCY48_02875 [Candidatus Magasanikbacteria bacterium]|nr:MAG: hypothetical protein A3I74_00010 [Candidatus Magasanikbacteria bacterium RIFCSPLOWO2_02_FULL_47_16]OGH80276.1 MAG: hypothetical protein A3C10_03845 [Candidatus Magasanikbacteria bacterium RIFCSPHIGHO2_02_FULL_48_18]OGH82260.1 MAG: hypothetical protein A3G08_00480 [Candidatus Magasanikbacteria bacterium RIFCSPLOWO2_12_FULL_47_9b]HAZ28693.1 hypothetical protein [Candidatus Magasanikbacteria bacterium]
MNTKKTFVLFGLLRISLGLVFLWAFFDKVFGLGFATAADRSWLAGVSPTFGFLSQGTRGPFAPLYQSIAGNMAVDWLFMLGLLLVGVCLILGIAMRLSGYAGALLMLLIWGAAFPPEHHPVLDEHIIYAFLLLLFIFANAGRCLGFGKQWEEAALIRRLPFLK